jgi:hypothetical protein
MTDRTDLDPVRISLPAAPLAALGPSSYVRKAFLQATSPDPVPLLPPPFQRSNHSHWLGAKGRGGEISAACESFPDRIAVFAWIAKP